METNHITVKSVDIPPHTQDRISKALEDGRRAAKEERRQAAPGFGSGLILGLLIGLAAGMLAVYARLMLT